MKTENLQLGSSVKFKLGSSISLTADELAGKITEELELIGKIFFFSDRGVDEKHFAVVQVEGIETPIIVPASEVKVVRDSA